MKASPAKSRRIWFSALALCLITLAAHSAIQAKENWLSIRTKNFLLIGNGNESDIRQVATRLEQFRNVFLRLQGTAKLDSPIPTTVIVFKSMNSYRPYSIPNAAGYFQKGEDVNYITLTTELSAQNPFSIIYHEYVHLMTDKMSGKVPVWFNEGLAEYYSSFFIEDDRRVQLGGLIPYHLRTLREGHWLPLRKLFAVDHNSPEYNENSKRGVFYAESWALTHYLLLGDNGGRSAQLRKYLELVAANVAIDDACKQAFETDIDSLEQDLKAYLAGNNFRVQTSTFADKLVFDSEMKTSLLPDAEVQAYLGDLLLHTNQLGEAENHLQQALALDPNQAMARVSLGVLCARQQRHAEARKYLENAVVESRNYLAHYFYAYALSREGMDENNVVSTYATHTAAAMRASLLRSLELNPAHLESYSLLAFVNLVMGEQLDQSAEFLKRALALSPGRPDLSLMLAQVYIRQEKYALARLVLEPLLNSKDRRLPERATVLLASIRSYEELAHSRPGIPPAEPRNSDATRDDYRPPTQTELLQATLGNPEPGQSRILGLFNRLECDDSGATYFFVQTSERLYRIRAMNLRAVKLTTYVPIERTLTCGSRKSPENVVLTFRATRDMKDARGKIDGDAVALDLVPKDFTLKP